jgi:hypothetical protein
MAFVKFENAGLSDSAKTQKWLASSVAGAILGNISWFSQWRRYAFQPIAGTVYDATCLREIADFIENRTEEHKSGNSL